MAEDEFWFDQAAADAAVDFFRRYARYTMGEWAGRPFELSPWQEHEIIRPAFGWKRADGTRRYRHVYIEVGGKNGKTELLGGVANLLLLADAEVGGEGYALAAGMDQAKIVFGRSQRMAQYAPELGKHLELLKGSTFCPELNAVFMPLAGTPSGKTGKNPSFVIGDETHEWPDDTLWVYVTRGMGARRQPMTWRITTGGKRGGVGWEMHERAEKIRDGIIEDPETLVVMYTTDPEDDWTDPETWAKGNPNLDISVKSSFLAAECRKAQDSPRLEAHFRSYHLCQWGQQATKWLSLPKWDACNSAADNPRRWAELEAELEGRPCFGGLDLSTTTDLAALVWSFPPVAPDDVYVLVCRFWLPEVTIEVRSRKDQLDYDKWAREGAIIATSGDVIDYDVIERQVYADCETFDVRGLGADPWNATQIVTRMMEHGVPVQFFRQGFASMSPPSKQFEIRVIAGKLDHGGHPVLRWNASNVCVLSDPAENIKPSKQHSTEKIDGIVSAVMATAEPAPEQEVNDLERFRLEVV